MMIEFIVPGIPRSSQTKSTKSKSDWKSRVEAAARESLSVNDIIGENAFSASIVYFYTGETELDVDSIGKLLLDGLIGVLYNDDSQAEQVVLRKTQKDELTIKNPPAILVEALGHHQNFVFVRLGDRPNHQELPL